MQKNKQKTSLLFYLLFIILILLLSLLSVQKINYINSKDKEGTLTLTFDDGYLSQYEIAFKEMEKFEFNGTIFIIANNSVNYEAREFANFSQLMEMQKSGWEIGSHSLSHKRLTIIPKKELKEEIELSKKILEEKGFRISSLAYPFGDYNYKVSNLVERSYQKSRIIRSGFNSFHNLNPFELKSFVVQNGTSAEKICSLVKEAKKEKLWLILTFHNLGSKKERNFDFTTEEFKRILDCINQTQIKVLPLSKTG